MVKIKQRDISHIYMYRQETNGLLIVLPKWIWISVKSAIIQGRLILLSPMICIEAFTASIFTAEKNKDFSRAYLSKKNVQDYVFADGTAEKSIERKFAEDMDLDDKVVVYAKLPRGFQIPTPVGNYAPDWAIAFQKGTVKHIYFIAETKGTMDSMELRPIEQAKIKCAKKLFNDISGKDVVYEQVDSYQTLLNIMGNM